jgi:hypothetical protein
VNVAHAASGMSDIHLDKKLKSQCDLSPSSLGLSAHAVVPIALCELLVLLRTSYEMQISCSTKWRCALINDLLKRTVPLHFKKLFAPLTSAKSSLKGYQGERKRTR